MSAITLQSHGIASRSWQDFGAAFTLEALAIAALIAWMAAHPPPPKLIPLAIQIEAAPNLEAPPPEPPKALPKVIPPPVKTAVVTPPSPPPPAPMATPVPVVPAPSERPSPSTSIASPFAPPAPPPPPPPPVLAGPAGPSADYIAKVRAAVQAAFVYPAAAKALEFRGRTRVAFKLLDATPIGARVLVGSGMNLVDKAALQAVQNAVYPPTPADQKSLELSFEVWVEFRQ